MYLQKGLFLATEIRNNLELCMILHDHLGKPVTMAIIRGYARCIEMLKAIEFMYAKKSTVLAESTVHITRQTIQAIVGVFFPLKKKLESSKKLEDIRIDMLAAIRIIESVLINTESVSATRRLVVALSYPAVLIKSALLKEDQVERAVMEFKKLNYISDIQIKVAKICDCSFLYWNVDELLPVFLEKMYEAPQTSSQARYLLAAYQDCSEMLSYARHLDDDDETLFNNAYKDYLHTLVDECLVSPLCNDIGNDLRLQIHSHLSGGEMDTVNPLTTKSKQLGDLLSMKALNIYGERVDMKQRVTYYLENDFYNLTTVFLDDFQKNVEMRNLAFDKYGIALQDNHLPMGSVTAGLDVLQIMRHIHTFVSRFNYNLNQQEFIERRAQTGSKHLLTINYMSISSSIRTHGMGIMSTTVDLTYRFLGQKFTVFNKFLNDEYIKSSLEKEFRWCKKNLKQAGNNYPYVQAQTLVKDIRKLGVREGMTYLDHFRVLISEIGNALGENAAVSFCPHPSP
jgi:WASH complex subunit 7